MYPLSIKQQPLSIIRKYLKEQKSPDIEMNSLKEGSQMTSKDKNDEALEEEDELKKAKVIECL